MAYSVIERHIWHDEKFRGLSRDARDLFLYLLTSPHSNRLGLYVLDRFYAASDVQMEPAEVDAALAELKAAGRVDYDPGTRLVLVRRFLKHNPLKNPNVVTAACSDLAELPFSQQLWEQLADAVKRWGKSYYKQLREQLAEQLGDKTLNQDPDPDPTPDPDQDHEQKQVEATSPVEPASAPVNAPPATTDWKQELRTASIKLADRWCDTDRDRRSFEAATEMLVEGFAWRNPHDGERIPEADRPALYQKAALRHFEKPAYSLDQSLTYVLKSTLDPGNDPEAKKRSGAAGDRRQAERQRQEAEVEADQLAMKRWEQANPDEAERIRQEAEAAVEIQGLGRTMMVKAETSKRIREAMSRQGAA